jgi:cell wall assembly regulator SMI1
VEHGWAQSTLVATALTTIPVASKSLRQLATTPTHLLRIDESDAPVLVDLSGADPVCHTLPRPVLRKGKNTRNDVYWSGAFTPDGVRAVLLRSGHEGWASPRVELVDVARAAVIGEFEVALADPMGGTRAYATPTISVSPDGARVIITCGDEVVSYTMQGKKRTRLAQGCYQLSPDGARVLLEPSPGTFLVRLVGSTTGVTFKADAALWSDDRHLVVLDFISWTSVAPKDIDRRVVFRVDPINGKRTKLATLAGAKAYAADATRFVAAYPVGKKVEVYVVDLARGTVESHVLKGTPSELAVSLTATHAFIAVNWQPTLHVLSFAGRPRSAQVVAPTHAVAGSKRGSLAQVAARALAAGSVLRKGASEKTLTTVEKALGRSLPDAVRAFYRAHDGADGTVEGASLLPLAHVVRQWKIWNKLHADEAFGEEDDDRVVAGKGVQSRWWIPAWIPITHDGSGNHHMLDLAPSKGGTVGQVISFRHDDGERVVVGNSLLGWLSSASWGEAVRVARPAPAGKTRGAGRARRTLR